VAREFNRIGASLNHLAKAIRLVDPAAVDELRAKLLAVLARL
jgi:hypothetical protein